MKTKYILMLIISILSTSTQLIQAQNTDCNWEYNFLKRVDLEEKIKKSAPRNLSNEQYDKLIEKFQTESEELIQLQYEHNKEFNNSYVNRYKEYVEGFIKAETYLNYDDYDWKNRENIIKRSIGIIHEINEDEIINGKHFRDAEYAISIRNWLNKLPSGTNDSLINLYEINLKKLRCEQSSNGKKIDLLEAKAIVYQTIKEYWGSSVWQWIVNPWGKKVWARCSNGSCYY